RDRRDRQHARAAYRVPARDELRDEARSVDGRLGVRHRAHRGEPAAQRRLRAARDGLGLLEARLAQMRVEIDEAAAHQETATLEVLLVHATSNEGVPTSR